MNERWDLTPIYTGLEAPEFAATLEKLDETVKSLEAFAKKLPRQDHKAALPEALDLEEQLVKLVNKLAGYASLEQSADTRNSAAMSAMGRVIALDAASAAPLAAIKEWIGSLEDLDALTEQDPVLKDYAYLLQRIQKDKVHQLPGIGEEVVAKLSQSDAWADMHQHLTSTVAVHYRGETTNLSAIRNLAYSDDPSVRKDAYEAELACYNAIKEPPWPSPELSEAENHHHVPAPGLCIPAGHGSGKLRHAPGDPGRHVCRHGRVSSQILAVPQGQGKAPGPRERPALVRPVRPGGQVLPDLYNTAGQGLSGGAVLPVR